MSAGAVRPGSIEAGALALQRVLALEGRDALSRVELAASELERFGLTPAIRERLAAIRDAVVELDSVLDRIERLADPLRGRAPEAPTRLADVLSPVATRLAPAFAARGLALVGEGAWSEVAVALPPPALERLLIHGLRVAVASAPAEAFDDAGRLLTLRLDGALDERVDPPELALSIEVLAGREPLALRVEPAARIELEVALVEARGRLVAAGMDTAAEAGTGATREAARTIAFRLPVRGAA